MDSYQKSMLGTHRDRLGVATKVASQASRDATAALGQAANYRDPNLSDDGLAARRRELREQHANASREVVASLRNQVKESLANVRFVASETRPKIAKNDGAALIRSQQKWDQARTMLESGTAMENILRNADLDTVLAIEEFGPSWIASRTRKDVGIFRDFDADPTAATGRFRDEIDRRLVHISDPDTAAAITALRVGEAQAQAAAEWLDHTEARIDGRGGSDMEVAIRAQYAEGQAEQLAQSFAAPAETEGDAS